MTLLGGAGPGEEPFTLEMHVSRAHRCISCKSSWLGDPWKRHQSCQMFPLGLPTSTLLQIITYSFLQHLDTELTKMLCELNLCPESYRFFMTHDEAEPKVESVSEQGQ